MEGECTDSNFRGLFVWNSGSRLACLQMEDFDHKENDQLNNCYKGDENLIIIYGVLTPKTLFKASLFWMEVIG